MLVEEYYIPPTPKEDGLEMDDSKFAETFAEICNRDLVVAMLDKIKMC